MKKIILFISVGVCILLNFIYIPCQSKYTNNDTTFKENKNSQPILNKSNLDTISTKESVPSTVSKKEPSMKTPETKKYNADTCSFPKNDDDLRQLLTPEQFEITKKNGTERPFQNAYWDNKKPGIYVDIISKEPLFLSKDKFDSGTGWPSFTKPIQKDLIMEKSDKAHGMTRTEVRSRRADSHLGHVFNDGPANKGGLRYCINSGSLRFVPLDKMKEEGYEDYLKYFDSKDWEQIK